MATKSPKVRIGSVKKVRTQAHRKPTVVGDAPSFKAGGKNYIVLSGEGALVSARTLRDRSA